MRSATRMIGLMAVVLSSGACGPFGPSVPLGMGKCPDYSRPTATVAVTVVDTDGQPVSGVRVSPIRQRLVPSPSPSPVAARLSCAPPPQGGGDTDAKGTTTVKIYDTGAWTIRALDASADSFADLTIEDGQTYAVTVTWRPKSPTPTPSGQ